MSLVARSEERLQHTLNYLQRLYVNKIFQKKERADVVAKQKKDLFNDEKEGSTTGQKTIFLTN